jgi:hypothetical protein
MSRKTAVVVTGHLLGRGFRSLTLRTLTRFLVAAEPAMALCGGRWVMDVVWPLGLSLFSWLLVREEDTGGDRG